VLADSLGDKLPEGIDGFHIHCHCENDSFAFERTLTHIESKFSRWFKQIKWINFGGGHLMTRKDYDTEHLVRVLREFKSRYPWLKVIMEPGSAFAWQTGPLVASVVDVVENSGVKTAILNVSFTCHMPDCLEMPYKPDIRGAKTLDDESILTAQTAANAYRLGGNSCLSGDFMGLWQFAEPLKVGDRLIFEDMIHYTTVKTNMFNGISHPSIGILHSDNTFQLLRQYTFDDYLHRMD
jgi:carboxynorspermidine decarboxylase